jgi:putative oxidoreductase
MTNKIKKLSVVLRIVAALIMLQTLYFKFSGAPESVYIFEKTGLGDAGRIGTGVGELIASVLLLLPATCWMGALMAIGLMSGAIFSHLTILGIEVMNDGGQLFIYAMLVLLSSIIVVLLHKEEIIYFVKNKKIKVT